MKKTTLYDKHIEASAKMVDFAGWGMPLHYGSQISEHKSVRSDAGIFDVSHMRFLSIGGEDATAFLRLLICGDVQTLIDGQGLYSCLLTEQGGIIDDLIVYKINSNDYRMVVNAGTATKDIAWMEKQLNALGFAGKVTLSEHNDKNILALQGPNACAKFAAAFPEYAAAQELDKFHFASYADGDVFVARTGYTGEDGYEVVISDSVVIDFWDKLMASGFVPTGLGCRDTLRLEAGMSLYGNDLDEEHSPLSSALSWAVHWNKDAAEPRDFIGKNHLLQEKEAGVQQKIVGIYMTTPGVLRSGTKVTTEQGEGVLTSGGFSPTLNHSIALARIPFAHKGSECSLTIRDKEVAAKIVRPPFVKDGKANEKMIY
ncbi:MAG: glycine cleavage system aminomethyltransferase GcvT [Candidatus Portiera sp.]|nr:glycine cleavage system aminomethyltransferase GcvT [Portiera sp.]